MGKFLQELKRRNVFRVGAAYVVVSWLILQVIETVREPLQLPGWTEAFFIVLLATGLPIALIFAWAFEITPEGLKKTREVAQEESVTAITGRKLDYAIIAILLVALGYFLWERQGLVERAEQQVASSEEAEAGTTSIAVLPFVNMSADPSQEYFSDGISEELLNLLAKIPSLRVPARTSSFQFKGQAVDIPTVAKQLNVAHVLEGSVRRAGDRIRVTAQLIEADSGFHLWSDTYDRELTDIFAIQDEISAAIVGALSETLELDTGGTPQVVSATNPEAYNAYLLGQHQLRQRNKSDIESAVLSFQAALEHDPNYAPAHAALGLSWYLLTGGPQTYGTLTLSESLAKAEPHIERALELDSQLADALGTKGLLASAREREEEAVGWYEKALSINPSQTDIRNWYSSSLLELGRHEESILQLKQAYQLDPLSPLTLNNYLNTLLQFGRHDDARPLLDRMDQIDPPRGALFRSGLLLDQKQLANSTVVLFRAIDAAPDYLRIRSAGAFRLLALGLDEDAEQIWPGRSPLPIVANTSDLERALDLARKEFAEDPDNPNIVRFLAWTTWNAGNREEGERLARRYLASLPAAQRDGHFMNWLLVLNAWQRGEHDAVQARLNGIEQLIDEDLAAGMVAGFRNRNMAAIAWLRGNHDEAYDYWQRFLAVETPFPATIEQDYREMGWDRIPRFAELRRELEDYRAAERRKFLAVACGPDGFAFWQPSPATCAPVVADSS